MSIECDWDLSALDFWNGREYLLFDGTCEAEVDSRTFQSCIRSGYSDQQYTLELEVCDNELGLPTYPKSLADYWGNWGFWQNYSRQHENLTDFFSRTGIDTSSAMGRIGELDCAVLSEQADFFVWATESGVPYEEVQTQTRHINCSIGDLESQCVSECTVEWFDEQGTVISSNVFEKKYGVRI